MVDGNGPGSGRVMPCQRVPRGTGGSLGSLHPVTPGACDGCSAAATPRIGLPQGLGTSRRCSAGAPTVGLCRPGAHRTLAGTPCLSPRALIRWVRDSRDWGRGEAHPSTSKGACPGGRGLGTLVLGTWRARHRHLVMAPPIPWMPCRHMQRWTRARRTPSRTADGHWTSFGGGCSKFTAPCDT